MSVITVGEEPSDKDLDSWKIKEEIEVSKPICVSVNTATELNKIKMNGRATMGKPNDPTEVYIVVNNSTNVHKLVILFYNTLYLQNINYIFLIFSQNILLMEL